MKTVRDLLIKNLPESVYKKAVANCTRSLDEKVLDGEYDDNVIVSNTSTPLTAAFIWSHSKEGYDYWKDINQQYFPR